MAKENKDEIDFEKIQSAIVDYIRFRKDALFVALMAAMSGGLLVTLAFTILGSFDSQSSSDAKISELFLVADSSFCNRFVVTGCLRCIFSKFFAQKIREDTGSTLDSQQTCS